MKILMDLARKILAIMPIAMQMGIKRFYYQCQIRNGKFISPEPEFLELHKYVNEGDWVIDIGANIGHYTNRFSELVGKSGRVIAFEPVPITFSYLAVNSLHFKYKNITLINAACSNITEITGISVPESHGMKNYYQAMIVQDNSHESLRVFSFPVDVLKVSNKISLIKIDVEGYEPVVMEGLVDILKRDKPTIIIESVTHQMRDQLMGFGYQERANTGSPNKVFMINNNR